MSHGPDTNHIYIRRRGTDTGQRRSINGFSRGCTYTAAKTSRPLRKSSKLAPLFRSFAVFYQKSPIFYNKEPCTLHKWIISIRRALYSIKSVGILYVAWYLSMSDVTYLCAITHLRVCHDSFVCVTRLIRWYARVNVEYYSLLYLECDFFNLNSELMV